MDNFKAIYKILSSLETQMDLAEVNLDLLSPESLGVSKERWNKYLEMLADAGYIKGVRAFRSVTGETVVKCDHLQITLKGLEYLQENAVM